MLKQLLERLLDIIYPPRCALCLTSSQIANKTAIELCEACQNNLKTVSTACFQCGIPLQQTQPEQLCGECLKKPPAYDQVISIYHYQQPLIWLIQQMKFHKKTRIAHLLAQLMSRYIEQSIADELISVPDAIIPVPLHHKRQHQRHFNQAEELSTVISKSLQKPIDMQYIERYLSSQQQSGLDAKQRKKNVKGIFKITNRKRKQYQHVVIIDDVMSTGSTVNEVAKVLKKSGIKKVDVWVLARADKK